MRQKQLLIPAVLASAIGFSAPSTYAEGETFVHLFEWQWTDIATECTEFLGPKGYKAVQVSPPQEHIQGSPWWTRYQPVTHALSTSRSGTASEFITMVNTCQAAGVDIYVDAVINHTAGGAGTGTAGSGFNSTTRSYPQYDSADFHSPECEIAQVDYSTNAWRVRNCNMPGLPDLKTGDSDVQQTLSNYLKELTDIGVAGFRIDAAKHMLPSDLAAILANVAPNTYVFQEVIDNGGEKISASEYTSIGNVTEFKYSGAISDRFLNGGVSELLDMGTWGLLSSQDAVVFTDNHDNQRGHGGGGDTVTYKNGATYELANVFMLAYPYGYPKVMSSYAFTNTDAGPPSSLVHNDNQLNCFGSEWQCEHRKTSIANMVAFRNFTSANNFVSDVWQNGTDQLAFGRGALGFVVINRSGTTINRTFQTQLPANDYCNVTASDDCSKIVTVDANGRVNISVAPWSTAAIHGGAIVNGNKKPTARIAELPTQVAVNTTLTLDGSASFDSDGSVDSFAWSTGAETAVTNVTLTIEGKQCFTLTVTDNENENGKATACTWVGEPPLVSNFDNAFFRGTSNNWAATSMTLIADNTWSANVTFTGAGDATGAQRFKIDRFGDWKENYGDNGQDGSLEKVGEDILFSGVGNFNVVFNDDTMRYSFAAGDNQAPVAAIVAEKLTIKVGDVLTLDGTASTDSDGSIASYLWNTGEATQTIQFSSDQEGVYTFTLSVTDNEGLASKNDAVISINVTKANTDFVSQYPTMTLRGTGNGWSAGAMTLVADYTWSTQMTFTGNNTPERFKFDVYGDWGIDFGDTNADGYLEQRGGDIFVNAAGTYTITLNELDLTYTVKKAGGTTAQNFAQVFVRGTFNSWQCTPLVLTADNTWAVDVIFDGQANQRFKLDINCDWKINYGDSNADGVLEQAGGDIFFANSGLHTLQVNDSTLTYQLQ